MQLPPHGLCLPCTITRVIDGDTLEVSLGSVRRYKVRLLDCWAPEPNTEAGQRAKEFVEDLLDAAQSTHLFIPAPTTQNIFSDLLTLERLLAHVFVSTQETLAERLVAAGHATRTRE